MRVISGSAKGRRLVPVPGETTRPITDRVKESLFDILAGSVAGSVWLDLFAGTGGVGIEALSRGASRVVFIDQVRKAIDILRRNLEMTSLLEGAETRNMDAFRYLRQAPQQMFDYIYVAPPQYADLWSKALSIIDERQLLKAGGNVIVQIYPKELHPVQLEHLYQVQERRYGSTLLVFYAARQDKAGEVTLNDSAV
ncbi:MAG: 16S rRNA (guanine(966)-N(2))-methyltransferase RsmD [Chloroflexi bacterium]|nr:16S rRNA (guanine(966)-N(2))-methyltransferase RsmD [Chloroflexota bacterium]